MWNWCLGVFDYGVKSSKGGGGCRCSKFFCSRKLQVKWWRFVLDSFENPCLQLSNAGLPSYLTWRELVWAMVCRIVLLIIFNKEKEKAISKVIMGDPLLTPALVGAAVSALLTEVIGAAKGAIHMKGNCKSLMVKVDQIEPLLRKLNEYSANWSEAECNWLGPLTKAVEEAKDLAQVGINESRYGKVKRLMKFWNWRKLASRLTNIVLQINEGRSNAIFVALIAAQSSNSACRASSVDVDFLVQPSPPLIVGVEKPLKKLKQSILASYAKDVPSHIGLQGRGGAGKTLLAQQLHNDEDIKALYGGSWVLWITVGLDARVCDIYKTMGKFLKNGDVFEANYAHQNDEEQRTYLLNEFAKKKVFMVLDDVWERQHNYNQMMYWLDIASGPGSTTLITTRSSTVLSKVHAEVEVVLMLSTEESWKLFCWYAFKSDTPSSNISEKVARDVCDECKGLPLALKVIGSAMADKMQEEEWCSALHDLRETKPILGSCVDDELYGRLQLSYNELKDDVTKRCFLYCAAFPEDYEILVAHLCNMWIAEGLFGAIDEKRAKEKARAHVEILVKRSMISWVVDGYSIKVHDVLRDLANYIIDTAKSTDCANNYCFHVAKQFETFPSMRALETVECLSLMQCKILEWPMRLDVPSLRVCLLSNMVVEGCVIPDTFFLNNPNLQYLDLSGYEGGYGGSQLCFEHLQGLKYLNLSDSKISKVDESINKLTILHELDLSRCTYLEGLPKAIGELKCLLILDLGGCGALKELPESIGKLTSLTMINLRGCGSLGQLPKAIGELKCLSILNLGGCGSLKELPESIGKLTSLTLMYLGGCGALGELPKAIGELKCLSILNLGGCGSLKELPESIGKLTSLTVMYLGGCEALEELPKTIEELKCLSILDLGGCGSLKELPESIGKLTSLIKMDLGGCEALEELPKAIGELKCLPILDLGRCGSLKELPESIGELTSLTKMNLRGCGALEVLPKAIGEWKCLSILDLAECGSLKELPESIGKLTSLTKMNLHGCGALEVLPKAIGELKCLSILDLGRCGSLKELPESIGKLNSLTKMDLRGCGALGELPKAIGELKCLSILDLAECGSLKELPESIGKLTSLTEINLVGCGAMEELPKAIGELKCLSLIGFRGVGP